MKKQLLITFMIFMIGYPAEILLAINNETNANKIILKTERNYANKSKGRGGSPASISSITVPDIDAFIDGNTITIYFNNPIEGNTTITVKNINENVIHTENVTVNKPMEITITLKESNLSNYLLEIASPGVYIYGML